MKKEEESLKTKTALSGALKAHMLTKPLSKITINDIVSSCHVNRKTFYYHFQDIYDLLKWTMEQEAIEVVRQYDLLIDYEEAIMFIIDYVENNKYILNCTYDSLGRRELRRFFYNDFFSILTHLFDEIAASLSIVIPDDYRQFICDFYTGAVAGKLIALFTENTSAEDKKKMVNYTVLIFKSGFQNAIASFPQTHASTEK